MKTPLGGKWLSAALMILLVGLAVQPARAENRAKCQKNLEKAETKLDQAVRQHGERSRQADQRRRDLASARERCWTENHAWYNAHDHEWHKDRDWDRH